MYRKAAALVMAIVVPGTAGALELGKAPTASFDVYATPRVSQKLTNSPEFDGLTVYGDGGGFRATARLFQWVGMIAEYQNTAAKEVALDGAFGPASGTTEEFRLGPGWLHESGSGLFIEYKQLHSTGSTLDGYGVRGRLAFVPGIDSVQLFTELGYATLEPTSDSGGVKIKDLQGSLGGSATFHGPWSLFAEYRHTQSTSDAPGDDSKLTQEDFRIGVRANLDY